MEKTVKRQWLDCIFNYAKNSRKSEAFGRNSKITTIYRQADGRIRFFKKSCRELSIEKRKELIDLSHKDLSVRQQSVLLGICRSSLYYRKKSKDHENFLINLIHEIWLGYSFYGYRRVTVILKRDHGLKVNDKKVLRLMRRAGIQAIYPKKRTSIKNRHDGIYPYLLKGLEIGHANQAWQADITYLKLGSRFVYLVALIDIYSRLIVGWSLSFELDTDNCLEALKLALKIGKAEIINSDQGCQFTSQQWVSVLLEQHIAISMDGKGRCQDNIFIERFWRTIKYEAIFLNEYEDFKTLYLGIKNYIEFYNQERPHQSLGYQTPYQVYLESIGNKNRNK